MSGNKVLMVYFLRSNGKSDGLFSRLMKGY